MRKQKTVERRNVWIYQPAGLPLENTPLEFRVTEPGDEKKLIGRLYVSKGGVVWCDKGQRYECRRGKTWEELARLLGE